MPKGRDWAVFGFILASLWIGLGSYGLVEPSDARHAEIGREMWVSGDYLFPRLMGIYHFHKPPLIYWLTTLGFSVFGLNEWGARACQGVLGTLIAWMVWRFARRQIGVDTAPWSLLFLVTTPAFIGAGRMLSTDLLLAACQTLALLFWYDVWSGSGGVRSLFVFYVAVGLSFLAKGPIAWLILILIILPFYYRYRRHGKRRTTSWGMEWGIPLVLLIAIPWYVYVVIETPGLLDYFIGEQLMGRLHSGGMGHPRSWYYYLGVFPALGFPWILLAVTGYRGLKRDVPPLATYLISWILIPPLFFSLPATKLPLYILLSYPAVALLVGRSTRSPTIGSRRTIGLAGTLFLLLGVFLVGVGLNAISVWKGDLVAIPSEYLPRLLFPPAFVFFAAGVVTIRWIGRRPLRSFLPLAVAMAFFPAWIFSHGDLLPFESVRRVGTICAEELREEDVFVEYRALSSGLPFYTGRFPLLVGIRREMQFEGPESAHRVMDDETFQRLWAGTERALVVTRARYVQDLVNPKKIAETGGFVLVSNLGGVREDRGAMP